MSGEKKKELIELIINNSFFYAYILLGDIVAKKYIRNLIFRCMIATIIFLLVSIFCNISDNNLLFFKNSIFDNNINFSIFNKFYKNHIDQYIPFDIYDEKVVISDNILVYKSAEKYLNGVQLNVGKNYNINSLCGGMVVYIGEKEKLGNTVIIQGTDGVDYWYSNINNLSVKLYDYIEKDTLIGTSIDDNIYLSFVKNGVYQNYEDYI